MTHNSIDILLVEDSSNDVMMIRRAISEADCVRHRLWEARDGQEALDFLYRRGKYADEGLRSLPDLILLDLNLPRVNGFEVLERVKRDDRLGQIPIVVLTTSEREEDISACYRLGANTFVAKPVDYQEFVTTIRTLHDYWCRAARLPFSRYNHAHG